MAKKRPTPPKRKRPEAASSKVQQDNQTQKHELGDFPLKKENFVLIGGGFLIVVLGYILMYGTEDIFSFRQMSLPVIIILLGFAVQLYGIMSRPEFLGTKRDHSERVNK